MNSRARGRHRARCAVARSLLLSLLLALSVIFGPAHLSPAAAAEARPAALSAQARDDVARIERYFNAVRTLKGRFLQIASTGETAEGNVALMRPGRMRIDYDPPVPILIVADGTWLIYHDQKLGQVSYLPLGSTPAGILVENEIRLDGGDLTITAFERAAGVIRVTVVRTASPGDGSLTLVFADNPLELRQWRVVDAQGIATTVTLSEVRTGVDLDPALFKFVDPRNVPPAFPK